MFIEENIFGQDPVDFNNQTAAKRIGLRIQRIRLQRNMTQAELGNKVGLKPDRIHGYESGARRPKLELLKKIALALDVSPLALLDPVTANDEGAMFAFFEMEDVFKLKPVEINGQIVLMFENGISGAMNDYLHEWYSESLSAEERKKKASTLNAKNAIEEEYNTWKWNFPQGIIKKTEEYRKKLRKLQLEASIEAMKQELSSLDE